MKVSILEYPTLVGRALMIAGMARGASAAAARLVLWRELAHGDGLASLERHLPELERSPRESPRLAIGSGGARLAEAGGASLLLVGPGALDLAVADASRSGRGAIRIQGATGGVFAAGLAPSAAERGMAASLRCEKPEDGGDVVLVCLAAGGAADILEEGRARRARATSEGIDIDEALWRRLRAYGDRILIPPSERSRRDAG